MTPGQDWSLADDGWQPPPALRAHVVPPAAGRFGSDRTRSPKPAGSAANPKGFGDAAGASEKLYDAEGRQVWGTGWGRWGVLYVRWRLRDGRWLQARQKVSNGAGAPVMLAVTAAALATDEPRSRWHRLAEFPAADLLGPPPAEDPAWAALLAGGLVGLPDVEMVWQAQHARATLDAARAGTLRADEADRVREAATWHRRAGDAAAADELAACERELVRQGWDAHRQRRRDAKAGAELGASLAAELRGVVAARLAGLPEAVRDAALQALHEATGFQHPEP